MGRRHKKEHLVPAMKKRFLDHPFARSGSTGEGAIEKNYRLAVRLPVMSRNNTVKTTAPITAMMTLTMIPC